jgi:hypothetical protein
MKLRTLFPEKIALRGFEGATARSRVVAAAGFGKCLGNFIPSGTVMGFDPSVAPKSGELAIIRGGDAVACKLLEYIGGRWFLNSFDGWFEWDDRCQMLGKVVVLVRWAPFGWLKPADLPPLSERFVEAERRLRKEIIPQLATRGWDNTRIFRKHVNPVLGVLCDDSKQNAAAQAAPLEVKIRDSIRAYLVGGD